MFPIPNIRSQGQQDSGVASGREIVILATAGVELRMGSCVEAERSGQGEVSY